MSAFSKPVKRYTPVEFMSIVVFLVLTITVMVAPFTANIYNSLNMVLDRLADRPATLSTTSNVVFVSDLQYWNANCSHGWSSDSTCLEIAARAQSCVNSVNSVYCSEYANYLEHFAE